MKLFAFTDIHGNKELIKRIKKEIKKEKPDILLCSGDLSNFGEDFEKLLLMFRSLKLPLLIIPGNHETSDLVRKTCKKTEFAISLHCGLLKINDYIFLGYGEGGFEKEDKDFEILSKKFKKEIKKENKTILITHAPPYKTKLDYLDTTNSHHGNNSIRKFIEKAQPDLVICGHLHENENKLDKVKKTIIINPGNGKIIEL